MGGFECSTHRRHTDGRRLDEIAATAHDRFALQDYARLRQMGMHTARDGLRWHLIETAPGRYDWSSFVPMLRAARRARIQVIWDLCHYGWPDDADVFVPQFPARFAAFARAAAGVLRAEGETAPLICPMNEISFLSWAAGRAGIFCPFKKRRAAKLKRQFARAAIAACDAILEVAPAARLIHTDPIINVAADENAPAAKRAARRHNLAQFEAWDMIAGRAAPGLGGQERYLDILGVNYYVHNQWIHPGGANKTLLPSDARYRPLRQMLRETFERYNRPLFIAETGIEARARPAWLRAVAHEAQLAIKSGVPLWGLCWYPIVDYPGWDDARHCPAGLWGYADAGGTRPSYEPLAAELRHQQEIFQPSLQGQETGAVTFEDERQLDIAAREMERLTELGREHE
jgi:beta-glucosidase/6-phospho-beta-glucosidase/beta-galactosidase